MQNIKIAYAEYANAERRFDKVDALWENDPENDAIERAWDEANAESHAAMMKLADEIVKFTSGAIDAKMARRMIIEKCDKLADIIKRAA